MSVIFDALDKLNKEKRAPKTGLLIVGAGSLDRGRRGLSGPLLFVATIALVLMTAAAWWWARRAHAPAPAAGSSIARPPATVPGAAEPRSARGAASPAVLPDDLAVVPVTTLHPATPRAAHEAGLGSDPAPSPPDESETARSDEPARLRLEAITMRDGGPIAIVNGRLVREGDVFDGIRIVRIGEDEVELLIQAEDRTLVLRF